jgi:NAD(P)-dependent dehydrogenase (short-subunit alcohol dehydrogenase family)
MKNLEGKHAVVFGAGGSVGAAVAKEFAAEGAEVFLRGSRDASRTRLSGPHDERGRKVVGQRPHIPRNGLESGTPRWYSMEPHCSTT